MKTRYLLMPLALGLCLTFALVWLLGSGTALAIAVLERQPLQTQDNVITVCMGDGCDTNTIQAAVDAANDGALIKVAAGTYTDMHIRKRNDVTTEGVVTQVVYISKTVTIRGGYTTANWATPDPDVNPATLDARGQGRVLYITGDVSPTIEGLRITGGDASGLGGDADGYDAGGGVYIITATATLSACQIYNNMAPVWGGGVCLIGSDTTLRGNTILSNTSRDWWCGGVCLLYSDHATLSDNTIKGNTSFDDGAGVAIIQSGDIILSGNTILNNTAGEDSCGGGAFVYYSDATLSGNTIAGNETLDEGGGVCLASSRATLSGNIISANRTTHYGGGVVVEWSSEARLVNNIIADNQAGTAGDGVYVAASDARLLHTTLTDKTGNDGSGVYVDYNSLVTMTNTILVGHAVGISVTGGNTVTVNGILWHSTPITIARAATATVTLQNQYAGDPAFTPDGYHITPVSAAMDAGVDAGVTTDVDGHHRPYGFAPDLGADEIIAISVPNDVEGTLVYTDTRGLATAIRAPAGTVTEPTLFVYTPVETATLPSGFSFAGHAFDLAAYRNGALLPGLTFNSPVTVTLHYADSDVAGLDEASLVLEYWNEGTSAWEDAACGDYDRHPDGKWLAVPICHLSHFALFGEAEEKYTIYLPLILRNY